MLFKLYRTDQLWIPRMSCGKPDRSEIYKVHVCQNGTWQIHMYCFPSVSSEAKVDSGGVHSLCTSESTGKNMPAQYLGLLRGPIRGMEGLGPFTRYQTLEV